MADQDGARRLLQSALDEFVDGARAVAGMVGSVSSGALGVLPEPVPAAVTRMLISLERLIDQAPPLTAELDIMLAEVHAKRLTVQALQAELAVFDSQLDVLEKSLAPLESWARQWARLRQSLSETLKSTPPVDE
jgi:hypothetical protein